MSNKKNNSKNWSGNQSRGNTGGFADAFSSAGISFTPSKQEEKEENKYKNYDPNKQGKKRSYSSGSKSQNSQSNSNNNKVRYLPPDGGPHAPYNFVPFSKGKKISVPKEGRYSEISDEKYTGEISYHLTAMTPIFVGDGKDEFCCNKYGKCIIPGSTMRGLVRNNLQILSFSDVSDDIDDYSLMYRAVAGGCLQKRYGDILGQKTKMIDGNRLTVLENVKAGYISREGSDYYLYNNVGDSDKSFDESEADYYVVSERHVFEHAREDFRYIIDKFQTRPPFEKKKINGRVHYTSEKNENYEPYKCLISYEVSNGRVTKVDKAGKLAKSGYVLSSGFMDEKKVFYVIPEIDLSTEGSKKLIPQKYINAYQIDCNRKSKTIPKQARSFYELPKDGEPRPIFYIELGGKLYFGYTPRLRLMYDYTIKEGLDHEQDRTMQDFAKTMFGFSTDKASRKSKVFFVDAVLTNDESFADKKDLILLEPKPTSYLEYLNQTNGEDTITYNSNNMELRGIKQYWLHEKVRDGNPLPIDDVRSTLNPLKEGSSFVGKIRFQNLSEEELGLLLWSIMLEKGSQMNVGKAKAYGYGRIKIDKVELYLLNHQMAYDASVNALQANPYEEKNEKDIFGFIEKYKLYAQKELGHDVMQEPSIRDFFAMKSETNIMSGPMVEYMTLDEFSKFKQHNNPLPVVQDICNISRHK